MPPILSIVIPTRKRPAILQQTLAHIAAQTIANQIEVIVVHDGEDDEDTRVMLSLSKHEHGVSTLRQAQSDTPAWSYFAIPKSQQGVARNRGVAKATAPLILFIGDDIFLAPDACEMHVKAHESHELSVSSFEKKKNTPSDLVTRNSQLIAVLGFTTWDPSLDITPVMKWLEKTGWQFGYPMIAKYAHEFIPKNIQERFTYASHISVPTEIAKKFPFNEEVTLYGWEDVLWGKELKDANIGLFYESDAKALHHHRITLEDSLARMETLGRSLTPLTKTHPDLGRRPKGWKRLAYGLIAQMPAMRGRHYKAFLRGLAEAR